jgi:hypothetical protein
VPADGEPHWLPEDRAKIIAYDLYDKGRCPCGCGRPAAESMARESQFSYRAEVIRCHARAAMDRESEVYTSQEGADTAGLMTRLTQGPTGTY